MLQEHKEYFRLFSDKEYKEMSEEKIKIELIRINEYESAKNFTTVQQLDILKAGWPVNFNDRIPGIFQVLSRFSQDFPGNNPIIL
jgi:hypothetical protein